MAGGDLVTRFLSLIGDTVNEGCTLIPFSLIIVILSYNDHCIVIKSKRPNI